MVLSLILGGVLTVLGAMLLFHANHLDSQKNKEITLFSMIGYIVLVIALLCGAVSSIIALNTNVVFIAVIGAIEIVAAGLIFGWHFLSWWESDIHEAHPSN